MKAESMIVFSGEYSEIKKVSLREYPVSRDVLRLIPARIAKKYQVLPLVHLGNTLTMAVSKPVDSRLIQLINQHTQLKVNPLFCAGKDIREAIQYFYSPTQLNQTGRKYQYLEVKPGINDISKSLKNPVEKWIIQLLYNAIEMKCTQIIFECTVSHSKVYMKILGKQQELEFPANLPIDAVVDYLKLLANHQESKNFFWEQQVKLDFDQAPVSIYFAGICSAGNIIVTLKIHYFGEISSLGDLGLLPGQRQVFNEILSHQNGMMFVSAAPESGKTTTLNAIANYMSKMQRRVIQLSQAIEIPNDGIVQIALPTWNQFDANKFWALIKQQKPCVLIIDDFYSRDVLKQVIELASDEIFVIFSLPFQDIQQLFYFFQTQKINLSSQQQYYLVKQFQVRQLCQHCKSLAEPDSDGLSDMFFQQGVGCAHCHRTGFQGNSAIFEINTLGQRNSLTQRKYPEYFTGIINGQPTLFEAGMQKVQKGEIEIEEIMELR